VGQKLSVPSTAPRGLQMQMQIQDRCPKKFLTHLKIHYLPRAVKHRALPILFDDDTSMLLTSPNNTQMQNHLNIVSEQLNYWFKSNSLFFLILTTYFIQFNNKSKCISDIQIHNDRIYI
jgi:hypothetical protein